LFFQAKHLHGTLKKTTWNFKKYPLNNGNNKAGKNKIIKYAT
jgi:hypothetical protein